MIKLAMYKCYFIYFFYQIRTNDDEKGNIFLIYFADNFVREYQEIKYISNYACLNFLSYLFIVVYCSIL